MSVTKSLFANQAPRVVRAFGLSAAIAVVATTAFLLTHLYVSGKRDEVRKKEMLIQEVKAFQGKEKTGIQSDRDFYSKQSASDFVGEVVALVNRNGLRLVSVKPDDAEKLKVGDLELKASPVTLKIRGAFEATYLFLHALEKYQSFLVEDGLVIEKIDEGNVETQLRILVPQMPDELKK